MIKKHLKKDISPEERQKIIDDQKIINLLDNTPNQPSKFKTKNWVEINDESQETYNEDNQIRFNTSMLRSSVCNYSNAYTLVKATITVQNKVIMGQPANNANKRVIFKNCATFTNCISRINNMQIDDAHDINVVISMYNLIEYSINYSKDLRFYGNIVEMNWL